MKELVIATTNAGKLREIKELLKDFSLHITSMVDYPGAPEIIEDGDSFVANAFIKARTMAAFTGQLTMGEDSGLEVQALNNAPGIYSARYAGPKATDEDNNDKLLAALQGLPWAQRQARYRCCAALVDGLQDVAVVKGSCAGIIIEQRRGTNGFGYDPLFYLEKYQQTFGELDPAIKATMSHRAEALTKIKRTLQEYSASHL